MTSSEQSGPALDEDTIDRGVSEFGGLLADLLARTPGACGAVLSDGVDDTIDTAHRPALISSLDISIAGAQIGMSMVGANIWAVIFGLGRPQIVVEANDMTLICKVLWEAYLMTVVLTPRANMARAMRDFDATAEEILAMLQ